MAVRYAIRWAVVVYWHVVVPHDPWTAFEEYVGLWDEWIDGAVVAADGSALDYGGYDASKQAHSMRSSLHPGALGQ